MSTTANVRDLQERAFEVFFQDLLCKAKPSTVEFVRECINKQLIGSMRRKIRGKCFDRLMKNYSQLQEENIILKQLPNATVLLDCLLDQSLLEDDEKRLVLTIPFLSTESFSMLFSAIASRCPEVRCLEITFRPSSTPQQHLEPIPQHSSLLNLSHLVLRLKGYDWNSVRDSNKSIFSIIGKCCPNLKRLDSFRMSKKDILALIVKGDLADILFPNPAANDGWSQDSLLPGLQIPSEFLNPLCSTLQEIRQFDRYNQEVYPFYTEPVLLAFAIRHFPKVVPGLKQIAAFVCVKIFCKAEKMKETRPGDFVEACRAAALSIGLQVDLTHSPISSAASAISDAFPFLKTMKELERVPLNDPDTLRALGCCCPLLVSVEFVGGSNCIDELEPILSEWPKLERVTFKDFSPNCLKPVLNAFGSALRWLELEHNVSRFDLVELAPCITLQLLMIWDCNIERKGIKRKRENDVCIHWTPETFLPLLEYLTIGCTTLGEWAPFLGKKTTLKRLAVDNRYPLRPLPDRFSLWSNLECLGHDQSTGLTLPNDCSADYFENSEKSTLNRLAVEHGWDQSNSFTTKDLYFLATRGLKNIWRYLQNKFVAPEDPTLTKNIIQQFQATKISYVYYEDTLPRGFPSVIITEM